MQLSRASLRSTLQNQTDGGAAAAITDPRIITQLPPPRPAKEPPHVQPFPHRAHLLISVSRRWVWLEKTRSRTWTLAIRKVGFILGRRNSRYKEKPKCWKEFLNYWTMMNDKDSVHLFSCLFFPPWMKVSWSRYLECLVYRYISNT